MGDIMQECSHCSTGNSRRNDKIYQDKLPAQCTGTINHDRFWMMLCNAFVDQFA